MCTKVKIETRETLKISRLRGLWKKKSYEPKQKGKGIHCRECEGFSHIQAECGNTLKKNRFLNTTLSNDEGKEETNYDEGDEIEFTETVTFNVVVYMNDTILHDVENLVLPMRRIVLTIVSQSIVMRIMRRLI